MILNYREYLITIGAVFLALALGILIGVSFGDSILAANQRSIIELMEDRLDHLKELELQQDLELQRWEEIKPLLRRSFRGLLDEKEIVLFSYCAGEVETVKGLLEQSGAGVTVILVQPRAHGDGEGAGTPYSAGEGEAALPFDPAELAAGEPEAPGFHLQEGGSGSLEWPPDCCLLLPAQEGGLPREGSIEELWRRLHERGLRTIALFPWQGRNGALLLPGMESELSLVDNIDTFWGQLALLMMLTENAEGHYGFDSSGRGLLPAPAEAD